jgi:RNA polymerase sigma-70 factor, ECF subfamily
MSALKDDLLRSRVPMLILRNVSSQNHNESGQSVRGTRPVTDDEQAADRDLQAISDLLLQARGGDPDAVNRLFPLVYRELGRLAHWQLQAEPAGHTLDTCALVHETFLKVVHQPRVHWRDRAHFFRVAAWAMRRILVDYARRYRTLRRGGGVLPMPLDEEAALTERSETLVALDEALDQLATLNQRLSQVVECRYFAGLTEEETAEALGVTTRTVQRDWAKARSWLLQELGD